MPDAPHAIQKNKAIDAMRQHLIALRQNRPSVLLARGRPAKIRAKIEAIIASARDSFVKDGHAGLSLRRVADHAGIAVGNLNYYFPTKRSLLDAMLRETLADYVEEHLEQFEAEEDSPLEILLGVVEFYVRNARQSHGFFYQLWGYAGCDKEAMKTVRDLYRKIGRFIHNLVSAANPGLSDAEAHRATLLISSLEEGYKLFYGMGPRNAPVFKSPEHDLRALTKRIVFPDGDAS